MTEMNRTPLGKTSVARKPEHLLLILTVLNVAFLCALWLLETFVAERHWLTTALTYMPQHGLGIPTLLLMFWAAFRRDWKAGASNALALVFFVLYFLGLNIPLTSASTRTGTPLRVMTYNILHGAKGAEHVIEVVNREQPDVLCLQEANAAGQWRDPIPEIQRLLPDWQMARYGELVTLSRHPIDSWRIHRLPTRAGCGILEATILVKGQRLTVLNTHFIHFIVGTSMTTRLLSQMSDIPDTTDVRAAQMELFSRVSNTIKRPFIAVGDFNTPPRGQFYGQLTHHCRESFAEAGWGLGYTYHADLPLMRIDYIFTSPTVQARRCFVPEVRASDHRPVVAELVLNGLSEDNVLPMRH